MRPLIASHFVVQELDIWEHGKNAWENPGGAALYAQYGGPHSVPFYAVLDASGRELGDGLRHGQNMGVPTQPDEVQLFLRAAAPTLTAAEAATLQAGLQRCLTF